MDRGGVRTIGGPSDYFERGRDYGMPRWASIRIWQPIAENRRKAAAVIIISADVASPLDDAAGTANALSLGEPDHGVVDSS